MGFCDCVNDVGFFDYVKDGVCLNKNLEMILLDKPKDLHFGCFQKPRGILTFWGLKEWKYDQMSVGSCQLILTINSQRFPKTEVPKDKVYSSRVDTEVHTYMDG